MPIGIYWGNERQYIIGGSMSKPTSEKYGHDVIVVLCAGLYFSEGKFYPTKYIHSDDFGMLGGSIRVDAALALYLQKKAVNFLFSAGVSAKQLAKYGPSVPPDAKIYAEVFLRRLGTMTKEATSLERPNIFLDHCR
jgi:hypothetical protein